jgi:hypothetical protein
MQSHAASASTSGWRLEADFRGAGLLALLLSIFGSCLGSGCVTHETVFADVLGLVVDASTSSPLADVEVRCSESTTHTDGNGRYRLRVPRGLRQLTYAAVDRPPVRKLVVVRQSQEITLDALLPAAHPTARPRLVFQRGFYTDSMNQDLPIEAGDASLVSVADDLGNDDQGLALGHVVKRPVWGEGDDDAVYYSVQTVGKNSDTRFDLMGVYRYAFDSKTAVRVWGGKYRDTEFVAMAPTGDAFVASTNGTAYLVEDFRGTPKETIVLEASKPPNRTGAFVGLAWAPSALIHLSVQQPVGESGVQGRVVQIDRTHPPASTAAGELSPFLASDNEYLSDPLPLADGRMIYFYLSGDRSHRGLRLRETDGTTRDLLPGAWTAVSLQGDVLLYIQDNDLHRRTLTGGQDLVIAQGTAWAAWR